MTIDITQIMVALVGLLGIIITSVIVPMIKANTTEHTQKIISDIVKTAVYAAQQIYTPEQWEEKKAYAVEKVKRLLESNGITLGEDDISDAIEATLKEIKSQLSGGWDTAQTITDHQ